MHAQSSMAAKPLLHRSRRACSHGPSVKGSQLHACMHACMQSARTCMSPAGKKQRLAATAFVQPSRPAVSDLTPGGCVAGSATDCIVPAMPLITKSMLPIVKKRAIHLHRSAPHANTYVALQGILVSTLGAPTSARYVCAEANSARDVCAEANSAPHANTNGTVRSISEGHT